jgi:hypothetical protein
MLIATTLALPRCRADNPLRVMAQCYDRVTRAVLKPQRSETM